MGACGSAWPPRRLPFSWFPCSSYEVTVIARNTTAAVAPVYLAVTTDSRIVNIATRGLVGTEDDEILISGFVTRGTGNKSALLRGVGPTLSGAPFNVQGALANPSITLFRGSTSVAANAVWSKPGRGNPNDADDDAATVAAPGRPAGGLAVGVVSCRPPPRERTSLPLDPDAGIGHFQT